MKKSKKLKKFNKIQDSYLRGVLTLEGVCEELSRIGHNANLHGINGSWYFGAISDEIDESNCSTHIRKAIIFGLDVLKDHIEDEKRRCVIDGMMSVMDCNEN